MDLFDFFWPGQFNWFRLLFELNSYLVSLFLLVIAGLAFMQHYRRPREMRLLLAAIALTLVNSWILWRVLLFGSMFIGQLSGAKDLLLINFGANLVIAFLGVAVNGAVWWCLFTAAFSEPAPLPDADDPEESLE